MRKVLNVKCYMLYVICYKCGHPRHQAAYHDKMIFYCNNMPFCERGEGNLFSINRF